MQSQLAPKGLRPAAVASPYTLLRRLHLDLTGIPPSDEQIRQFIQASAKDAEKAYQQVVDRLLKSSHFGERWALWWLDAVRYADSNGYEIDRPRSIWPYRDWVISAFNAGLPFDQFAIEQLAGGALRGTVRRAIDHYHRRRADRAAVIARLAREGPSAT